MWLKLLNGLSPHQVRSLIERPWMDRLIIVIILFNAVILGLATSNWIMERAGTAVHAIDRLCLWFFVVELLAKIYAYRKDFFVSKKSESGAGTSAGWNLFDFFIVGISVFGSDTFSVLRALRILRLFRAVSVSERLRNTVESFVRLFPKMGGVFMLLGLIHYVGAVMATTLFAAEFPDWFGTLGKSAFSLFQIMTLESWSMGIVRPVMEVYPFAWLFFVPFVIVAAYCVANLFVALIVDTMQTAYHGLEVVETNEYRKEVLKRLDEIERRLESRPE
ncbi:MAG: ion transporter [Rhodobacter sp.]|nr:ion transporter [Rhodobacter sp.]MCY4168815.1 ion transporter [Rhodobacter sp.]MCY4241571.1 ion transporter [Rhodobacter sp.]